MAITPIAALAVAAAVPAGATTQFVTTSDFVLVADGFEEGQVAILHRLGPSGEYFPATNKDGAIYVSSRPNIVRVDTPGTFRISKNVTSADVAVGYEEV